MGTQFPHLPPGGRRGIAGRGAVVTGGTSGIGEAVSRRLIADGALVVAMAIGEEEVAAAHERIPGLLDAIRVDVSDPAAVADAFASADRSFAGVDTTLGILVANAGISIRHRVMDITPEEWRRVLAVNLDGVFYCAREAAARMADDGGVILMTASTNGIVGHPYYADYNASKAGVILLARTMALELAPRIRVNAVCPGYVLTPMQRAEYTPEMLAATDEKIPLGRHAQPGEIAALFSYLASDEGAYVTGAAIPIDGGELAGGLASRDWLRSAGSATPGPSIAAAEEGPSDA
jgi:meso-butanediol dehydrogenase/(S,S)-butanediol dehydrogenase/diacetyl reductase